MHILSLYIPNYLKIHLYTFAYVPNPTVIPISRSPFYLFTLSPFLILLLLDPYFSTFLLCLSSFPLLTFLSTFPLTLSKFSLHNCSIIFFPLSLISLNHLPYYILLHNVQYYLFPPRRKHTTIVPHPTNIYSSFPNYRISDLLTPSPLFLYLSPLSFLFLSNSSILQNRYLLIFSVIFNLFN